MEIDIKNPKPKLTRKELQKRNQKIIEMIKEGIPKKEIAELFSVEINAIYRVAYNNNIDLKELSKNNPEKLRKEREKQELQKKIIDLVLEQEKTITETAKILNIGKTTVAGLIRKTEIQLKFEKEKRNIQKFKKVLQLKEEGMSAIQIAKRLEMSESSVFRIIREGEQGIIEREKKLEEEICKKQESENEKKEESIKDKENKVRTNKKELYGTKSKKEILIDEMVQNSNYYEAIQIQLKEQLEAENWKPIVVFAKEFFKIKQYEKASQLIEIILQSENIPIHVKQDVTKWKREIESKNKKEEIIKEIMKENGDRLVELVENFIQKGDFYHAKQYVDIAMNCVDAKGNIKSIAFSLRDQVKKCEKQAYIQNKLEEGKDLGEIASELNMLVREVKAIIEEEVEI